MIKNRIIRWALVAFYVAASLLAGCLPEDSLQWSDDGSVGLLRVHTALYLVDGQTGKTTTIAADHVAPLPDISRDGRFIVYAEQITCETLDEGLKSLPANQVALIERDARRLREKLMESPDPPDLESLFSGDFSRAGPHSHWVARYVAENADDELADKLGADALAFGRQMEIGFHRIVLVRPDDLDNRRALAVSLADIMRPRISPDGRHVAYLMVGPENDEKARLYVASADVGVARVATGVAFGFAWRPDSKAIAYLQETSGEGPIGTLNEKLVTDSDGQLRADPADPGQTIYETHVCAGSVKELAGVLFEPLMHVQYGSAGRIFFSSAGVRLPTSDLNEARFSLFCCDTVTGAVADVLPAVTGDVGQLVNYFALSPDGTKVLLPVEKNRFSIYRLGSNSAEIPVPEEEGFGDKPDLLPAWKGNEKLSCLVAENSHFLVASSEQKHPRKEYVVLDDAGRFVRVLSKGWPDELLP